MTPIRPDQILKILAVTDSCNIHRESIVIPLTTARKGTVDFLSDGRLRITCPTEEQFDAWLIELRDILMKIDNSKFNSE